MIYVIMHANTCEDETAVAKIKLYYNFHLIFQNYGPFSHMTYSPIFTRT